MPWSMGNGGAQAFIMCEVQNLPPRSCHLGKGFLRPEHDWEEANVRKLSRFSICTKAGCVSAKASPPLPSQEAQQLRAAAASDPASLNVRQGSCPVNFTTQLSAASPACCMTCCLRTQPCSSVSCSPKHRPFAVTLQSPSPTHTLRSSRPSAVCLWTAHVSKLSFIVLFLIFLFQSILPSPHQGTQKGTRKKNL